MSNHIDHAAEAVRLLNTSPLTAEAQVHATLALVEQQRIANLLTLLESGNDLSGVIWDGTKLIKIRGEIRKGLGL